jgi:hypothetical protein
MELILTQNIYDEFAIKAKWQQTAIGLIKKEFNLKLSHKDICEIALKNNIMLTKQDQTYYEKHSNVEWANEWKVKCSKGHEEKWASLTEKEKTRLGKKYVQSLFAYRNSLSKKETKLLGKKISKAKIESRNNMTDIELAERYKRMSEGWDKNGEDARNLRCSNIKKTCWDDLTPEQKSDKCIKVSKHLKGKYAYVSVDGISFDSTWEELLYRALVKWDIPFNYTNTSVDKNILYLNHSLKSTWKPDFILKKQKVILEVKGFIHARNKFWNKDLPAFIESKYAHEYSLYLVDFPINPMHLSLEDVLISAKLCHLASNKQWNKHLAICSTTSKDIAWLHSDMQNNKPREFGGDL